MGKIGWGITGAGYFLHETFDVIEKLAKKHSVSCFITSAGERVVRIYGLWQKLTEICPGNYYREVILGTKQGAAFPLAGRFLRKTYDALIVSPASANTVAKIIAGISDTLVTNAIAQAEKGGVPIIIVPSDQVGIKKTRLPYVINREICLKCEACSIIALCPFDAIIISDGLPKIDLTKCEGCSICLKKCPHGAVTFDQEVSVAPRKIDIENVRKMQKNKNYIVLNSPKKIPNTLNKVL
ncbi:MAG: dihydromethanopterin reductase (acceptor) [Candidatus Hadarchaeaceae archaeon]